MFDNEFPPLGGGTGVVNLHLFEELAKYPDVEVDLVTSSRTRATYEESRFSERIRIFKVPVGNRNIHHATNPELLRYVFKGARFGSTLARRNSYDLSFAFAGVPAGALSYLLWQRRRLPYIVSLQGTDVPGFEQRYAWLYPILAPLLRRIWRNASAVLAISEEHRRLAHAFMPAQEIAIVPNGVDTALFHPAAERAGSAVTILCVGRLIERKGQHHLLKAFAGMRSRVRTSARLVLAGTGDAAGELEALARSLHLGDAVEFLGAVPREEIPALYRSADVFVLPSQCEGMSMALLEALASGLPAVTTPTGGADELIRDGENGVLVPWADTERLSSVLANLVDDHVKREAMGWKSRGIAQQYEWSAITRQYLTICEAAMAAGGTRR
jgi:phosphatidyl-myo-inositol dimannoside synthase